MTETREIYEATEVPDTTGAMVLSRNEDGEVILQVVGKEVTVSNSDSIEVTKNTKGYTWSAKLYFQPGNWRVKLAELKEIKEELLREYGGAE